MLSREMGTRAVFSIVFFVLALVFICLFTALYIQGNSKGQGPSTLHGAILTMLCLKIALYGGLSISLALLRRELSWVWIISGAVLLSVVVAGSVVYTKISLEADRRERADKIVLTNKR